MTYNSVEQELFKNIKVKKHQIKPIFIGTIISCGKS